MNNEINKKINKKQMNTLIKEQIKNWMNQLIKK